MDPYDYLYIKPIGENSSSNNSSSKSKKENTLDDFYDFGTSESIDSTVENTNINEQAKYSSQAIKGSKNYQTTMEDIDERLKKIAELQKESERTLKRLDETEKAYQRRSPLVQRNYTALSEDNSITPVSRGPSIQGPGKEKLVPLSNLNVGL